MNHRNPFLSGRAAGWLIALALLLAAGAATAQQDPPGRIGRLNVQQGAVSFSPAGGNDWFEADANRPLTTGDRLWTDRDARAELHLGADTLRLDEQTGITLSELDDDTARITASQGNLQLRVREELGGRRLEIGTPNLAAVVDGPGDYRIETDPAAGITRVAVASGRLTLFGEGGESVALGAQQQLIASGRHLAAASGAPIRDDNGFDRWVAERDRIEEQSISARYVSREVVGYQQLDAYGDWQSDPTYGNVWYPRGVDAEWAPYRDGQWVDVAPWGWTWVDAAPWGFAPAHYGRWARIGPRWGWVPGQRHVRPVYSPALVGFVGGAAGAGAHQLAIGGGRHGVGWFPLAPGEAWRPGYRASQRYVDEANRAAFQRQIAARRGGFAHQQVPGAVTVVPSDMFGRGPAGRRDVVRLPANQLSGVPAGMGAPIPLGDHGRGGFGRPGLPPAPQAAMQARQFEQARQIQQQQIQQRAVQAQAVQAQQMQMLQQAQQAQQMQQAQRLQQAQQTQQAQQLQQAQQMQQAQQLQQAQRQQIEAQQRAAQAQQHQQMQIQQQAMRQQQEAQQRAAQAQAQQLQAMQQLQAQRAQQQVQAQQQMLQAQQAQAHAIRQAQEMQQRAQQVQQQQRAPQRSGIPAPGQQQQPDRP